MSFPTPGKPVRGSKSGNHLMALFDLLGRSWAMGIIWRLNEGPCTFRALQERCESISPSTLNKRLKELTTAALIQRTVEGYGLTDKGEEIFQLLHPLETWARTWAKEFNP
ncbi:winged helix-turn-helix transcriptional regulator [Aquimarina spongiae]|uniref:Transcriptional regulator, HxlR family n=1 Tax=Aquimarina spongiae TaxID=570521 RepID=A0A1M6F3M5_9FLAO|nr:helix-turn-helix domain-containing protein [Aquimarina spongiae]SHI92282.1 transcriptional regulator, HxlR family [Aquimarina spongiae]